MTSKRKCSICKKRPSRDQKKGGYCQPCNNEYGRANYRANKERYFKQAKERDDQLDELINTAKAKPCADCNVSYPPYVMDFDHIEPEKKFLKISTMRRRKMAFDKIREEIAKCEVVCANCHRERTNKQNPARYTKTQNAPGATWKQVRPLSRQKVTT